MTVSHEPWLVALSLIVAFQGSFVGLSLAVQVTDAVDPRRRFLLAGAALTLALAIWSMHFVGMLAARLPVAVDFLVLPTLLSFLVCVLVVGVAVFGASNGRLSPARLGLSALVMGAGICTMHYLGMYALHASSRMIHDPVYVVASFLVAFNAAGLALWLSFGSGRRPPVIVSAAVLALAISAMHYTAMAGMLLLPLEGTETITAPSVGPGTLAIIIACVAFLVSGLFLLTLVPDQMHEDAGTPQQLIAASGQSGSSPREVPGSLVTGSLGEALIVQPGEVSGTASAQEPAQSDTAGIETSHPRHRETKKSAAGLQAAPGQRATALVTQKLLPVERDGLKGQINTKDVFAIQADAHYTRLFDGTRELFCPLAISEIEQLLDPKIFSRVHRSHIVNLAKVGSHRRSGDGGLLTMEGTQHHHAVPVSRSRWTQVRSRLVDLHSVAEREPAIHAAQ